MILALTDLGRVAHAFATTAKSESHTEAASCGVSPSLVQAMVQAGSGTVASSLVPPLATKGCRVRNGKVESSTPSAPPETGSRLKSQNNFHSIEWLPCGKATGV